MTGILCGLPGTLLAATSAAISHIGTVSGFQNSGNNITLAYPAGMSSGDVAIFAATESSTSTPTTPTGYTLLTSETSIQAFVYYRVLDGTENGSSVALTFPTNATGAGTLSIFRNVHADIWDATTASAADAAFNTTVTWPSITTNTNGALILRLVMGRRGSVSATGITYTAPATPAHTILGQNTSTRASGVTNRAAMACTYQPSVVGAVSSATGSASISSIEYAVTIALKRA